MKKTLCMILATIMLLSMGMTAFAEGGIKGTSEQEENPTSDVVLEVAAPAADYEVTIATEMNVVQDTNDPTKASNSFELSVKPEKIISEGMTDIIVTLKEAQNDANSKHWLKHVGGTNKDLEYTIKKGTETVVLGAYNAEGATVLLDAVASGDEIKATLNLDVVTPLTQAGKFKDLLTFSIGEIAKQAVK